MEVERIDPGVPEAVADALTDHFRDVYGRPAEACFAAPGRVNLIGEHVDYNDGRCLPIALPHATYTAVARRDDDVLEVTSQSQQTMFSARLTDLGPGRVDGWPAYVGGVVWALREDGIDVPGLQLAVDSRVPIGAGLSSSAALECSVALAVCHLAGVEVDTDMRRRLVRLCMRAENEVVGAPTGGMDQTISLLAEPGHALLLDCQDWSTTQLPLDLGRHGLELLVVDTRASHALSDGGYAARRRSCEEAARVLGVRTLREVTDAAAALDRLAMADPTTHRRARHVLTEMARVDAFVAQLTAGDFTGMGGTMDTSHESLREDLEVSSPELDVVVDVARHHGALGARMTGAGFGGSAIALVERDAAATTERAVAEAFEARGWQPPRFLRAAPSGPAARIR